MGNIRSVQGALTYLGIESRLVTTPAEVLESEMLILPGVGSFAAAMANIRNLGLVEPLDEMVLERGVPVLGICLGMQLLAEESEEDGPSRGFGWIRGRVERFNLSDATLKVPHIGFNTARFGPRVSSLFAGLGEEADFYFVHSYRMTCDHDQDVTAWVDYGEPFVAAVERDNVFGAQFHPEKSQSNGLKLLKNFASTRVLSAAGV
jgi:imidazole glycerol-phosphate synthase subunit HisH